MIHYRLAYSRGTGLNRPIHILVPRVQKYTTWILCLTWLTADGILCFRIPFYVKVCDSHKDTLIERHGSK